MQKTSAGLYIIRKGKRVNVYTEKELKELFKPTLRNRIERWFDRNINL
jgi:hypothetical protein